jgi:hypothetical protein
VVDAAVATVAAQGVAVAAGGRIRLLPLAVLGVAAEAVAASDLISTLLPLDQESGPAPEEEVAAPAEAVASIDREEEVPIAQAVAPVE